MDIFVLWVREFSFKAFRLLIINFSPSEMENFFFLFYLFLKVNKIDNGYGSSKAHHQSRADVHVNSVSKNDDAIHVTERISCKCWCGNERTPVLGKGGGVFFVGKLLRFLFYRIHFQNLNWNYVCLCVRVLQTILLSFSFFFLSLSLFLFCNSLRVRKRDYLFIYFFFTLRT